ncbi:hypothetical protein [Halovivax sp.]|uniref:hypothetical protein n=1 Tax=Halovivax sp. TaxID=1935978 RepID=UPI0025C022F0|nr:hypothetical protein [Halovivax sp.]
MRTPQLVSPIVGSEPFVGVSAIDEPSPEDRTNPDDRDPSENATPLCPRCTTVVTGVYTVGPEAPTASPCDCPLSPEEVSDR